MPTSGWRRFAHPQHCARSAQEHERWDGDGGSHAERKPRRGFAMTAILPGRSFPDPVDSGNLFEPVARLSTLASALAQAPLGPGSDFRADLRTRLMEEAS